MGIEETIKEFEDTLNPLKLYCRFKDIGITDDEALRYSRIYEEGIYKNILELLKGNIYKE